MGNLVFQATLGGQVSLVGPNTASTFTLNVPAVSSTLATLAANTFTGTQTLSTLTSPAATALTLQSAGTTALTVDTSQNVGLVNTPSAWQSTKKAFQIGQGMSLYAATNQYAFATLGANVYYNGTNNIYIGSDYVTIYQQNTGAHNWYTAPSGTAGGTVSLTNTMALDASGNLTVPAIYTNTTAAVTYVAVSSAGLLQRGGVSALKYKQDVRDLESIDINKFRAVRYKSKCENDDKTLDHFGFIADEVLQQGLTELITFDKDGEVEGFQYERMCVVLLKNAQTQAETINALTARVAALEAK